MNIEQNRLFGLFVIVVIQLTAKQDDLYKSYLLHKNLIFLSTSRGKTCFWDGRSGTLETAVDSHKADVLSVALSEDQTTVYSSGVDPVVQQFVRIPARKGSRRSTWVRSVERKTLHTHDVRAMVVAGTHLFSGGSFCSPKPTF